MRVRLIILGGAILALAGCVDLDSEEFAEESNPLEREIRGFSLSETQEGVLVWVLNARVAYRVPGQPEIHLDEPRLTFYDESGEEASWLTSRSGVANEINEDFTAKEQVLVTTAEGDTLRTEELSYHRELDLISGPGWVQINKPDRILTGVGFESKPDLSDYTLKEEVHVTLVDRDRVIERSH